MTCGTATVLLEESGVWVGGGGWGEARLGYYSMLRRQVVFAVVNQHQIIIKYTQIP